MCFARFVPLCNNVIAAANAIASVGRIRRRAEVSTYFDRHDEAENLFREIDRKDLAISLRERLGDCFRVVQVTVMSL